MLRSPSLASPGEPGGALEFSTAYTLVGGLWADAITDTVQLVLMCASIAIAIPAGLELIGGVSFLEAALPARHLEPTGGLSPWLLLSWAVAALTVLIEPAFHQRILAAKDRATVTRSLLLGIVLWAAYDWGVTLLGLVARAAVEQGLLVGVEGSASLMSVCLLTLPVGLKGLLVAGILAAAMSSVDSYSLLASGNLICDIYQPLTRRAFDDRTLIRLVRAGVLAVLAFGVAASFAFEKLADAWVFLASVLVSIAPVPVLFALYGRPRPLAGLCSSAAGLFGLVGFCLLIYTTGEYVEAE